MSPVCSIVLLFGATAGFAAEIGNAGINFPVRYEGGSLPLNQGKINATVAGDQMIFHDGKQRLVIPLRSITAVTYGSEVHRGSPLRFVPFLELDKAYYVSLSGVRVEAVLKLREGQSKQFVAALERLTGIKAVNADRSPAIVRYETAAGPPCCTTARAERPGL